MRGLSGVADARWAEVPHPLQSLDRVQVRGRAELAVAQFVDIVTGR